MKSPTRSTASGGRRISMFRGGAAGRQDRHVHRLQRASMDQHKTLSSCDRVKLSSGLGRLRPPRAATDGADRRGVSVSLLWAAGVALSVSVVFCGMLWCPCLSLSVSVSFSSSLSSPLGVLRCPGGVVVFASRGSFGTLTFGAFSAGCGIPACLTQVLAATRVRGPCSTKR